MSLQQRSLQPRVSRGGGIVESLGDGRSLSVWFAKHDPRRSLLPGCFTAAADDDDSPEPADGAATLDEVARAEQDFLRQRLREELKREPSEEELSSTEKVL